MAAYSIGLLFLLLHCASETGAQTPAAPAPGPAGPPNVTAVLEKAGQFTILLRLLKSTQVGDQINTQLNNSNTGLTLFAPTDNSFASLPAGTLNSLSDQQKVRLVQFHVLPSFVALSQFQTVSNPLRTQAGDASGGGSGGFPLNVTSAGNQVNITTGVVNTTISNTLFTGGQLAVYQVDQVLLPMQIFGHAAPPPTSAPPKPKKRSATSPAEGPSGSSKDAADASAARGLREMATSGLAGAALLGFFFWWEL